jgi:putative alpha-1,2-mannosidase
MDSMYGPSVDGLCGNDDAGQMSAWYIFSSLGFYPVTPGSNEYALGSPLIKEATIHLNNGNALYISSRNQSRQNVYVQKIIINGKEHTGSMLSHKEIKDGGEIIFQMSDTPNDN